ncbi:MAG: M48 family metalloprotease, partial [Patescibacteria group bacterium]
MYGQIAANRRRTVTLFVLFFGFLIGVGWGLSYYFDEAGILLIAVLIALVQAGTAYFAGDKIALAVSGAKLADRQQFDQLHDLVENLAIATGLPKPRVYIINDPAPNAFATGRNPKHSAVAVTTGLLELLDKRQLEAVLAHELAHVKNNDILVATVAVTLVGVLALISDIFLRSLWWRDSDSKDSRATGVIMLVAIVLAILAPLAAKLIQLAISRSREFLADADGVLITRFPEGLVEALVKIEQYERPMKSANRATAHLYINEPFGVKESKGSWLA